MSTYTYRQVLNHVQQLTPDEQLQLMGELATILRQQITTKPLHSVMEFKGLGKEIWQGVDVQEYINQERFMGWIEGLKGNVVGMDTVPLIYFIEENLAYTEVVDPFFEAVERREFSVVTSAYHRYQT